MCVLSIKVPIRKKSGCDHTPSAPGYINFFKPFHFLVGDSSSCSDRVSHISSWLQEIKSREWEKKEQRTNEQYGLGLTQVQED